eukprot:2573138-Pleurochrysis_carterae.AAC.1
MQGCETRLLLLPCKTIRIASLRHLPAGLVIIADESYVSVLLFLRRAGAHAPPRDARAIGRGGGAEQEEAAQRTPRRADRSRD